MKRFIWLFILLTLVEISCGQANSNVIVADTGSANNFLTGISNVGVITKAQPSFSNLSGTWTLAQGDASNATANKVLMSGASAAPTWSVPTFPNASATSLKHIRSDGTNWIASTVTYPDAAVTAGKVIVSDGTNYIASTPTFPNASATSRKITVSDGTNWVASTETWAVPGTVGNMLKSDGTNWTATDVGAWDGVVYVTTSDATTTGQSLVDITGLVTPTLTNSTLYEFEAVLQCTTTAVTTGTEYGIHGAGTGTAATCNALVTGSTTTNAGTTTTISAVDTATAAFLTSSGMTGTITIKGWFTSTSTGTATLSIQHLKVTSGTSTVKKGSSLKYRKAHI